MWNRRLFIVSAAVSVVMLAVSYITGIVVLASAVIVGGWTWRHSRERARKYFVAVNAYAIREIAHEYARSHPGLVKRRSAREANLAGS
jgi:hypothetical protein